MNIQTSSLQFDEVYEKLLFEMMLEDLYSISLAALKIAAEESAGPDIHSQVTTIQGWLKAAEQQHQPAHTLPLKVK